MGKYEPSREIVCFKQLCFIVLTLGLLGARKVLHQAPINSAVTKFTQQEISQAMITLSNIKHEKKIKKKNSCASLEGTYELVFEDE